MRSSHKSLVILSSVGLMAVMSGCKTGGSASTVPGGPITVPLIFQPNDSLASGLTLPTGNPKVYLQPVSDDRTDKTVIGHNTEDATISVVSSGPAPAQFVHDAIATELRKVSIDLVDSPDTADRVLTVSLKTFTADEASRYTGEVITQVQVADKAGKVLIEKSFSGESSTWGHSKEPENYQKILRNSVVNLTSNLLSDADTTKALSLTPKPGVP